MDMYYRKFLSKGIQQRLEFLDIDDTILVGIVGTEVLLDLRHLGWGDACKLLELDLNDCIQLCISVE